MKTKKRLFSGFIAAVFFAVSIVGTVIYADDDVTHNTITISEDCVDKEFVYGDTVELTFTLETLNTDWLEYYYVYIYCSGEEVFYYRGIFNRANGCPYTATYTYTSSETLPVGTYRVIIETSYTDTQLSYFYVVEEETPTETPVATATPTSTSTPTPTATPTEEASDETETGVLGDINSDNEINYLDAMTALRYDAELVELDDTALTAGDVNYDGSVDSLDAILILRYDAGLIDSF